MGNETESKLKARIEQWQSYVETGFIGEAPQVESAVVIQQAPPVSIFDAAQMAGKAYGTEDFSSNNGRSESAFRPDGAQTPIRAAGTAPAGSSTTNEAVPGKRWFCQFAAVPYGHWMLRYG